MESIFSNVSLGRGVGCLLCSVLNRDLYPASLTAAMFAVFCYIGPRYNDTLLY